jgi:hypothetical protein
MDTQRASVRVRPLRFGFVVDPRDTASLRTVLRLNSCLWGGKYNHIIPSFARTPARYREDYLEAPSAKSLINGLVEAFQPDFLVETTAGVTKNIRFDARRILPLQSLIHTVSDQRRYGIDVRSICAALYRESFRFVQRHPPNVVLPRAPTPRYEPLFAAAFGEIPDSGDLAEYRRHFADDLDAKEEIVHAHSFNKFFAHQNLYPLRIGCHELGTQSRGWNLDPTLFYMDERSSYDIIEYWNLRAIGWRIRPLPVSWAQQLRQDCESFIAEVNHPSDLPSNRRRDATFLCSRSCSFQDMQSFVSSLKRPTDSIVTVSDQFPRLWDEWGRHADNAEPQTVTHLVDSVTAYPMGLSVAIGTTVPDFLELSDFASSQMSCANVIEALPGGAPVIPWQSTDMRGLATSVTNKDVWTAREGIVALAGEYRSRYVLRTPSPINVFTSWAEAHKLKLELSSAGRIANEITKSLGELSNIRLLADEKILGLLNDLAHGDFDLELSDDEAAFTRKRHVRTSSAPRARIWQVLLNANSARSDVTANHLRALLNAKVLTLGMKLLCRECQHVGWYSISQLDFTLTCERCLRQFAFPQSHPPAKPWAYRVIGPFAVGDFAAGSYSVLMSAQFLAGEIAEACTWIPSFELKRVGARNTEAEADFGMFLRPRRLTKFSDPWVVFGECKTFGPFKPRDFARARKLASLFPGAAFCFCTLKDELSRSEKRQIARIARAGRRRIGSGRQKNPVIVLTRRELFGQFKDGAFADDYSGELSATARRVFAIGDVQEIADFTQRVHLGIESYYEWRRLRRASRRTGTASQSATVPSKSPEKSS